MRAALVLAGALLCCAAAPASKVTAFGKGLNCAQGYVALQHQATDKSGESYMAANSVSGKRATVMLAKKKLIWSFTLKGDPAYPAAVVARIGKPAKVFAGCGYGDPAAFQAFVKRVQGEYNARPGVFTASPDVGK